MISILTGDILGSRGLTQQKRTGLEAKLRAAAAHAGLEKGFEVFRGDSWQGLCEPSRDAFESALQFRAYLLGHDEIDTRISIGIGAVETLNPKKISLSQGEAFELSGLGLSEMPKSRRLVAQSSSSIRPELGHLLSATCSLLDGVTADWTSKQALAIALSRSDANQYELAQRFNPPISAQAFGKHLARARWKLIKQALDSIQRALQSVLPNRTEEQANPLP